MHEKDGGGVEGPIVVHGELVRACGVMGSNVTAATVTCLANSLDLSCEAARRDATTFDMLASGDGLSAKDDADVAADIKVLVFGSKLAGAAGGALAAAATFAKVPALSHDLLVSSVDGVDEINELGGGVRHGRARRRCCGGCRWR